jgi:polysaccharide pyruvyl transferase WcaK-like protein
MNAFLVYGYAQKNAGDMAITFGAIDLLLELNFKITIMSRYPERHSDFEKSKNMLFSRYGTKIKILPCIFKLDREAGFCQSIYNYFNGLLTLFGRGKQKQLWSAIESCDAVFFNGGNLIRCSSINDGLRLLALGYPLKLARKARKPFFILPQSTARTNFFGRLLINRMIKGATCVFVRESISKHKILSISKNSKIHQCYDLAFYINDRHHLPDNKSNDVVIAITLRSWTVGDICEFDNSKKNAIVDYFTKVCNSSPKNYKFLFVSQGVKDSNFTYFVSDSVAKSTDCSVEFLEELDPISLGRLYSKCSALIGMRLHSIILAAARGIPSFGVFFSEWGYKNPGIMKDLGLKFTFLDEYGNILFPNIEELVYSKGQFSSKITKIIESNSFQIKEKILNNVIPSC